MADFRKMFFVLAALVMIIGSAIPASAQLTCTAFVANQPIMRQEGATEPGGDIIIQCTVGAAGLSGAQTGSQTLSLYVSGAAITSRQLATTGGTSIPTEAALLVNDVTSTATQGFLQNGALVFTGFLLPSTPSSTFQIRVTNVRVNANALASGAFVTGTILGTFPIQNQTNLVLGVVQTSLSVSIGSVTSLAQCTSITAGSTITTLKLSELINGAWKAPAVCTSSSTAGCSTALNTTPGQWYQNGLNTESQTVLTTLPGSWSDPTGAVPGQADWATRIRLNFSNIPAGVTITLPSTVTSGSFTLQATAGSDVSAFSPATTNTVSVSSPSGSVVYEVRAQSGSTTASINVPIAVAFAYTPPSTPAAGNILVSATYAPTTAEITTLYASPGIPRFADTSVLSTFVSIVPCQTDLLFTFLTNQAGFDTGLEIANTSTDPFGTAAQNGTCTLSWYGTGPAAGTTTTTPSIASGSYWVSLVSSIAPGFQGYMIAVCNFQFAHGFAFLSDGYGQPGRGLSQGYLASIIPTPGLQAGAVRNASDAALSPAKTGEGLNQ